MYKHFMMSVATLFMTAVLGVAVAGQPRGAVVVPVGSAGLKVVEIGRPSTGKDCAAGSHAQVAGTTGSCKR